jgi:3-oxo-5-alpha-steroid 4-dehydrogenase 3
MQIDIPLTYVIRGYFLLTSVGVLVTWIIPPLRVAFVPYGKTLEGVTRGGSLVSWLAGITVPKAWFWHYYALSVALSVFWGLQIVLCSWGSRECVWGSLAMVDGRTIMLWGMMLAQGCRRLYETVYVQRSSPARMWIGHYMVGVAFYVMMSIAVLVEGSKVYGCFL